MRVGRGRGEGGRDAPRQLIRLSKDTAKPDECTCMLCTCI